MADRNVDEVVMPRTLSNGQPDHPAGSVYLRVDGDGKVVDRVPVHPGDEVPEHLRVDTPDTNEDGVPDVEDGNPRLVGEDLRDDGQAPAGGVAEGTAPRA